jgi:hypothetical protein
LICESTGKYDKQNWCESTGKYDKKNWYVNLLVNMIKKKGKTFVFVSIDTFTYIHVMCLCFYRNNKFLLSCLTMMFLELQNWICRKDFLKIFSLRNKEVFKIKKTRVRCSRHIWVFLYLQLRYFGKYLDNIFHI